ncbi:MAG: pyruvate kinase [Clostridia bacterium]|nr:pyruvate kinase [Clostridia bacterium]
MRKTKIIATIGPASRSEEILTKMISAGMNVARLNFSHGTHEYHKETIDLIKKVRKEKEVPLGIMLDMKGPEVRTKSLSNGKVTLKKGAAFTLTSKDVLGDENIVSITYPPLCKEVEKNTKILIDDGSIELCVLETTDDEIKCKVVRGGALGEKKGINVPSVKLGMPYLSDTDKKDILFGIENDVDFIAASFVRTKNDVIQLRKFVNYHGGHKIKIISKIENTEGIDNFDEILLNSDGIMVARGDMGVEVDYTRLPGLQKRFIKKCYRSGKMVITATQMLESMIKNPTPTRAEITDVANAVFDGTSAVMLSGETAMGNYPVEAVEVMANISQQAEDDCFDMDIYSRRSYDLDIEDTTNAICDAARTTATDLRAKAIIALTMGGDTARNVSKFRPSMPIVAATPEEKTFHQLSLSWGVCPVLSLYKNHSDDLFVHAIDCAKNLDIVEKNDMVVIIVGIPLEISGNTNTIKVAKVK